MSGPRVKVSVAQAFDADERGANPFLHRALELIDRVHRSGYLPRVQLRLMPADAEFEYRPTIPPHIFIDTGARRKLSTMIHTIGHVLDQFGFGTGEYNRFETSKLRGTNYQGILRDWWHTIHATQTVTTLVFARENPTMLKSVIDDVQIIPDRADLAYMASAEELWARSYLQYIAIKTQDEELLADLRTTLNQRTFVLLEQWPEHEFAPIAAQIDTLFTHLGWI